MSDISKLNIEDKEYKVKDAKCRADLETAIEHLNQNIETAKDYLIEKINDDIHDLKGGASSDYDTLGEIEAEIKDDQQRYAQMFDNVDNAISGIQQNITTIQSSLDTKIEDIAGLLGVPKFNGTMSGIDYEDYVYYEGPIYSDGTLATQTGTYKGWGVADDKSNVGVYIGTGDALGVNATLTPKWFWVDVAKIKYVVPEDKVLLITQLVNVWTTINGGVKVQGLETYLQYFKNNEDDEDRTHTVEMLSNNETRLVIGRHKDEPAMKAYLICNFMNFGSFISKITPDSSDSSNVIVDPYITEGTTNSIEFDKDTTWISIPIK